MSPHDPSPIRPGRLTLHDSTPPVCRPRACACAARERGVRGGSSAGQSSGLIIRRSWVQAPPAPPGLTCGNAVRHRHDRARSPQTVRSPSGLCVPTVRHVVKRVVEQSGIRVQRHRRRSVAKHGLEVLHVGASRDRQRRRGVAQVVGGEVVEANPSERRGERSPTEVAQAKDATGERRY